jgi:hypothetical protein
MAIFHCCEIGGRGIAALPAELAFKEKRRVEGTDAENLTRARCRNAKRELGPNSSKA